mmetsp:Transcript_71123/g.215270  ORF Transcript_71123/g.215270 Transcript_71123/m.215270 type:complete len:292 (-) Transcript_71123:1082-1957(-)
MRRNAWRPQGHPSRRRLQVLARELGERGLQLVQPRGGALDALGEPPDLPADAVDEPLVVLREAPVHEVLVLLDLLLHLRVEPLEDPLRLLGRHFGEGVQQGLDGHDAGRVRRVAVVLQQEPEAVQRHEAPRGRVEAHVLPALLPDGLRAAVGHGHVGVAAQDDGQQHVQKHQEDEEHVGKEPNVHEEVRHAGGQDVARGGLDVDVPRELAHEDDEAGVDGRARGVELDYVAAKEHVADDGERKEHGQEDDQEVHNVLKGLCQRVRHHLQPRVGLKRLEELRHDREQVRGED